MADVRLLAFCDLDELIELYEHLHEADDPLPARRLTEEVWRELCDDPRYLYFGAHRDGRSSPPVR